MLVVSRRFVLLLAVGVLVIGRAEDLGMERQALQQGRDRLTAELVNRQVPVGSGVISGVVTSRRDGHPLAGAQIVLTGEAELPGFRIGLNRSAMTDNRGEFRLDRLPAGSFEMRITHAAYVSSFYGETKAGGAGVPIHFVAGASLSVKIELTHSSAIMGTVTDDSGDFVSGAQVRALRRVSSNGLRRLVVSGLAATDDLGRYRLFGLQPGDYLIAVTPSRQSPDPAAEDHTAIEQGITSLSVGDTRDRVVSIPVRLQQSAAPPPGYLPTYYPSQSAVADARVIALGPGDDREGADVRLQIIRAGEVLGSIVMPSADLKVGVQVSALAMNDETFASDPPSTRAALDGTFSFRDLAPGRYRLMAQTVPAPLTLVAGFVAGKVASPAGRPAVLWGETEIVVDGNGPANATVVLHPGRSIFGRIASDRTGAIDLATLHTTVTAKPALASRVVPSISGLPAEVDSAGRFAIRDVVPGRYVLAVSGPISIRSEVVDGQEVLDFPLVVSGDHDIPDVVITVADRPTNSELTGTLYDQTGAPASGQTVVLFAVESKYWTPGGRRILTARSNREGVYGFRGMPAGDYFLVVATDLDPGGQFDRDFLAAAASGAARVTIVDGVAQQQSLRIGK